MERTYKLQVPIQFGQKSITELTFKPSARAFKGFSQKMLADGGIVYEPFELASVAIRMAGEPNAVAEMLAPEDMNALAQVAMGFLGSGLATGS